jgi:AGCS family alanine or glycine:cation symporter
MEQAVNFLNDLIWSKPLIYLCLGTGLWFSLRTRFLQVRHAGHMARLLFRGAASERGVSPFQAFALAISGRVGTGTIAGVATAIAMGGPGAVFWMWMIAFLGAGSAFVEAALAQIYKEEIGGQYRGGPAYYVERGLGLKW